jgi:hypothetical protein
VSKTYRALAIVAVVATLLSVGSQLWFLWFLHASMNGWFSYAPLGAPTIWGIPFDLMMLIWQPTITLAAPVVGAFSVIVAAQARRWGWLVALTVLGLLALYGPGIFFVLEPYTGLARLLRASDPNNYLLWLPQALLVIATLLFVATAGRGQPHTDVAQAALP